MYFTMHQNGDRAYWKGLIARDNDLQLRTKNIIDVQNQHVPFVIWKMIFECDGKAYIWIIKNIVFLTRIDLEKTQNPTQNLGNFNSINFERNRFNIFLLQTQPYILDTF